jgi:hypothetical protein
MSEDMNEIADGMHTRTKILILAVGTLMWLLIQIVINFLSDLLKLALIGTVLYLLYLAGEIKIEHRLCGSVDAKFCVFSPFAGEGRLCSWEDFEEVRVQTLEYIYHAWKMIVDSGSGGE